MSSADPDFSPDFSHSLQHVDSDAAFTAALSECADTPCVLSFGAKWCPPCRALEPLLAECAAEFKSDVAIYKIDTDKCQEAARAFSIAKLPTTLVRNEDGETIATIVGADIAKIRAAIGSVSTGAASSRRTRRQHGGNTVGGSDAATLSPAEAARQAALARFGAAPSVAAPAAPAAPAASSAASSSAAAAATAAAGGDSEVATFLVSQLASMGFAEAHARSAVAALGDGASVDAAVDWMLEHPAEGGDSGEEEAAEEAVPAPADDAMETGDDDAAADDDGTEADAGPHTHQALCDVCTERIVGVRYRCDQCSDYDLCEKHFKNQDHAKGMHTFTGHKTEFVPGNKAPLTAEELAEKKAKLKERLARVRAEREAQEAQEKHASELARIKNARESAAIRERLKEQQAEREAAKLRREKELEAKHKAKVKASIAKDKAERRAAAEARKREREGGGQPAQPTPAAAAAPVTTGSKIADATEATVQIRLKGGKRLVGHFSPDDTIATVAAWATAEADLAVGPKLGTAFPRKTFSDSEAASTTLRDADLVPRGALVEY
eukprot:CAMPEP_0170749340 /NCGR_PEP_ID=MMETSP0437-20130122/10344_1 /TAXON_ID=0 /ORGANISM="Sexangularia sp." /LENGTH=551 /DNA_ID=CAMNT_0011088259 /DNA_START=110 /DNA_END=1765 /DNA_ORIENTATION=-